MKQPNIAKRSLTGACLLIASAFVTTVASAGTYQTINVTGSDAQFSGVANSYLDASSTGSSIDIESVQITNDSSFLYLNVSYLTPVNPNDGSAGESSAGTYDGQILYMAFDLDANAATGFNPYGNTSIGSELGYDNDFPFQQATGVFNTGATVVGGGAEISPYDTATSDQIIAIPLTSTVNGVSLFTQSSIDLAFYSVGNSGTTDFTGPIAYTLAAAPEPATWSLLLGGFAGMIFLVRRRRMSI